MFITKDSEVEVSSKDEGFKGAWYNAILEENPTKTGRKKLRVRYTTLLQEEHSTPLSETVEQSSIRPVPPQDLQNDVVFEEGLVVDADLKDGWWTGVVIKKLEDDKFLVYFEYPPDVIEFKKNQLRAHFDWIESKWIQPETKELSKSMFSCGTSVEVSCKIDKLEAVWVPALIVKEIEENNKFIVKCCNKSSDGSDEVKPNMIVDVCEVRPVPPPFFVEEYPLLDRVDAFHSLGWRQGLVRGILSKKRYSVSFVATKEESVFRHSDLRPCKEWEDGVWHQGPKRNLESETPLNGKRKSLVGMEATLSEAISALRRPKKLKIIRSSVPSSVGEDAAVKPKRTRMYTRKSKNPPQNVETSIKAMELPLAKESDNQMADNDATTRVVTPQVIPLAKEPAPPVTAVINATLVEEPEAETQGKVSPERPVRMQNGLGTDSNEEKVKLFHGSDSNGNETTPRRKREQKNGSSLNQNGEPCDGSKVMITETSDDICDKDYDQRLAAWMLEGKTSNGHKSKLLSDEAGENENTTLVMPFVKQSPIWKVVESMELFETVKQTPHFSPLFEIREEFREGSAVGEMVKFYTCLERVKNLQLDTPKSTLERLKECFYELEKYGFDIIEPLSRIDLLLPLKDRQIAKVGELKGKEKEMAEEIIKKQEVEEVRREVKRKILELQSREAELKEKEEALEKDISEMQLCASSLDKEIQDVELEIQSIVAAPW